MVAYKASALFAEVEQYNPEVKNKDRIKCEDTKAQGRDGACTVYVDGNTGTRMAQITRMDTKEGM